MTRRLLLALVLFFGLAACSDDGETSATNTVAETTTTTTAQELTPFPEPRETLEHGGDAWAVVLAAAEQSDGPELQAAEAAATAAGFFAEATDCDAGAEVPFGYDEFDDVYTVSVYFHTEVDAQQALQAFHDRGWQGGAVALVQTYCMD